MGLLGALFLRIMQLMLILIFSGVRYFDFTQYAYAIYCDFIAVKMTFFRYEIMTLFFVQSRLWVLARTTKGVLTSTHTLGF